MFRTDCFPFKTIYWAKLTLTARTTYEADQWIDTLRNFDDFMKLEPRIVLRSTSSNEAMKGSELVQETYISVHVHKELLPQTLRLLSELFKGLIVSSVYQYEIFYHRKIYPPEPL